MGSDNIQDASSQQMGQLAARKPLPSSPPTLNASSVEGDEVLVPASVECRIRHECSIQEYPRLLACTFAYSDFALYMQTLGSKIRRGLTGSAVSISPSEGFPFSIPRCCNCDLAVIWHVDPVTI